MPIEFIDLWRMSDADGMARSAIERHEIKRWRHRIIAYAMLLVVTLIGPLALVMLLT